MRTHLIGKKFPGGYHSQCGEDVYDPDLESGTTDPYKSDCRHCLKIVFAIPFGLKLKSKVCPECGRALSPAHLVQHLKYKACSFSKAVITQPLSV